MEQKRETMLGSSNCFQEQKASFIISQFHQLIFSNKMILFSMKSDRKIRKHNILDYHNCLPNYNSRDSACQ